MKRQEELLKIFRNSVETVLQTMTGLPVAYRNTGVKPDHLCEKDFCGIMDFFGNAKGTCALCMPEQLARKVCFILTQFPDVDMTDAVLIDTVAEICNQIAGNAKALLDKTPYGFQMSTPRKLIRERVDFTTRTELPCIVQAFEVAGEGVHFMLSIISADGVPLDTGAVVPEEKLVVEEDMKEIVDGFVVETEETLTQLDLDLLQLESEPANMELVNKVFRAFHTVKGNSGALGFTKLQTLDHHTEDVVRKVRDGKMLLTPQAMDVVFRAVDVIKGLLADIKRGVVSRTDLTDIETELLLVLEEKYAELEARKAARSGKAGAGPAAQAREQSATLRVDTRKLDTLMDVTGELTLTRNRLLGLIQRLDEGQRVDNLEELLNELNAQMGFQVSGLQGSVMSTRMQPIGKVFNKYTRIVRDLSREIGKEIDLVIKGGETELDTTIVDSIGDPLIHMVRNSCDHGIEAPEVRAAAGKPARGRIDLSAYQEGSAVIIEIRDDGKGLNADVLKKKALEKGLITPECAATMPKSEALGLIFLPGFSTAEKVTEVSGRGVGMDVVNTGIARLSGVVELHSEVGRGTTVRIKLPLTLSVMQGLEVEVGDERYLLPQEALVEIVRLDRAAYARVVSERKFLFRDRYLNPVVDLGEALGLKRTGSRPAQGFVAVIGEVDQRTGVLVDNVLRQHEAVIKPLGRFAGRFSPEAVTGATLMGDGSIELILNHRHLIGLGQSRGGE
ncbi:MAG: ATP-binding protein [Fibrobacterota bacterium]